MMWDKKSNFYEIYGSSSDKDLSLHYDTHFEVISIVSKSIFSLFREKVDPQRGRKSEEMVSTLEDCFYRYFMTL